MPELSREEMAKIEIGHTSVSRRTAVVLVALFLATIAAVPAVQHVYEIFLLRPGSSGSRIPRCYGIMSSIPQAVKTAGTTDGSALGRVLAADRSMLRDINEFEGNLEDDSVLARATLPSAQELFVRVGLGNEKAYCGLDGWLFYRPGLDYLTGPGFLTRRHFAKRLAAAREWEDPPQPDPRPAIRDFNRQLAARGIRLVIVPVPGKAMIHPEKFSRSYANESGVLQNESYPQLLAELEQEGVLVFDPAPLLLERKLTAALAMDSGGRPSFLPQFLETDTHWRPEAMQFVAERLAAFIADHAGLPDIPPVALKTEQRRITNLGDIALMLRLQPDHAVYRPEAATIRQVMTPANTFWQASKSADVLLLGDSFTNIYSLEAMGWGESAGLAEQLAFAMRRPLDRITRNDSGAWSTRQMLARELAAGRDRLAGKKLVVWQFAIRELSAGDWKRIDMTLGNPRPAQFVVPASGTAMAVSGTIESIATAPRPGTVPYKDHIIAIHLVDVEAPTPQSPPQGWRGGAEGNQAIVYAWSMRDNKWTPAARLRPGTRISATIRSWADVAGKLDAINRAELDDESLQLEEPCWAEDVR